MSVLYIDEKSKKVPVSGKYDVAVVGGGIAGVSAALAASRLGKKVILFERMFGLGGLATLGLITIYLPICDGYGHQVSFGLAEELLRLSIKYGLEDRDPGKWLNGNPDDPEVKAERQQRRFQVQFNGNVYAILLEKALLKENVRIAYGTTVCSSEVTDGRITSIITESKSGRCAYLVDSVIDASGDADMTRITGEQSAVYSKSNPLAAWYSETVSGKYNLVQHGVADIANDMKIGKNTNPISASRFTGIEESELSEMMFESHDKLLEHYLSKGNVSKEHALSTIPSIPQIRMTRRIDSGFALDEKDAFKEFKDSIGIISDWRKRGPIFEIPFRCLHGNKIKNLLFAGRCISVTDDMWDISRVIPACAVTGEAAGTAATLTNDFTNAEISAIQFKLRQNNVRIHISELKLD